MLRNRLLSCGALVAALLSLPTPAAAEGFELSGAGARGLGRASALAASAADGLALYYNPALIARFGQITATADLHLNLSSSCFERQIVTPEGTSLADYRGQEEIEFATTRGDGSVWLPDSCSSGRPSIIPEVGIALPVGNGLAIGLGILVPSSTQVLDFVDSSESVGIGLEDPVDRDYNSARYLLTESNLLQVFPTLALAYETPDGSTSIGVGFAPGVTTVEFGTVAFAGGLGPATADAGTILTAHDFFVPRVSGGVHVRPVDGFEIGASFWYTAPVKTTSADLEVNVGLSESLGGLLLNPYTELGDGSLRDLEFRPLGDEIPDGDPRSRRIGGAGLRAPQTWNITFATRYASALEAPADDIGDQMSNEQWDVELDVRIRGNAPLDVFDVTLPSANLGAVQLPEALDIPHFWKNQVGVRIGGDYLVVPGHLAIRAGFSYETHGVERGYEQLDFAPFERFGVYGGLTARFGIFDLTAAYGRLIVPNVTNTAENAQFQRVLGAPASTGLVDDDCSDGMCDTQAVNAGVFRTHYDLLSLGATIHFDAGIGGDAAEEEPVPADGLEFTDEE